MFNRILFWTTLTLSKRFFKQFHCIVLEKMNHKVSYNYISAFIIVSYFNCNKKKKNPAQVCWKFDWNPVQNHSSCDHFNVFTVSEYINSSHWKLWPTFWIWLGNISVKYRNIYVLIFQYIYVYICIAFHNEGQRYCDIHVCLT